LVVTDSGGLQKEAYFFKRFCVTVRDQTEWVELVEHGYNRLSSTNPSDIQETVQFFLKQTFKTGKALYGNGDASSRICRSLLNHHGRQH
jgi:UDP-GlcNAc3NAcA epimerase